MVKTTMSCFTIRIGIVLGIVLLYALGYVDSSRAQGSCSGWGEIAGGGRALSGPTATLFSTAQGTEVHVFVRGTNDRIYQNISRISGWTGWSEVPGGGLTPSGPAVTQFGSELRLFVRGIDDKIYQNIFSQGTGWTGWSQVPGGGLTPSGPGVTQFDSELRLVVRGIDDAIYQNISSQGAGWTGWSRVPGGVISEILCTQPPVTQPPVTQPPPVNTAVGYFNISTPFTWQASLGPMPIR